MEHKSKQEVETYLETLSKVIPYLCKMLVKNCNKSRGFTQSCNTRNNYSSWCLALEKDLQLDLYELFCTSKRYIRLLRRQDRYDAFMIPFYQLWEEHRKTKTLSNLSKLPRDIIRMIQLLIIPKDFKDFVTYDADINIKLVKSQNEKRCSENTYMWDGIDSVTSCCIIFQWVKSYTLLKDDHGPIDHMIGAAEKIIIDLMCHTPLERLLTVKIARDFNGKSKKEVRSLIRKYMLFGYPEYIKKQYKK